MNKKKERASNGYMIMEAIFMFAISAMAGLGLLFLHLNSGADIYSGIVIMSLISPMIGWALVSKVFERG